jgi:hypothetical protein
METLIYLGCVVILAIFYTAVLYLCSFAVQRRANRPGQPPLTSEAMAIAKLTKRKTPPLEWILFWGVLLVGYFAIDVYAREVSANAESKWVMFGALVVFLALIRAAYRGRWGS